MARRNRYRARAPLPGGSMTDPDAVGALVSGTYHGTPFVGRVRSIDIYGHMEIDLPPDWTHNGRDYSGGISTTCEVSVMRPRTCGKVAYDSNGSWVWTRSDGRPWPRP